MSNDCFKVSSLFVFIFNGHLLFLSFRFPAEVIRVDISGKRFDRMSVSRKSMLHVPVGINIEETNENEIQTVRRRSRSKKPRGKRRNTIAGTDQKEIEDAANGYVFCFICYLSVIIF